MGTLSIVGAVSGSSGVHTGITLGDFSSEATLIYDVTVSQADLDEVTDNIAIGGFYWEGQTKHRAVVFLRTTNEIRFLTGGTGASSLVTGPIISSPGKYKMAAYWDMANGVMNMAISGTALTRNTGLGGPTLPSASFVDKYSFGGPIVSGSTFVPFNGTLHSESIVYGARSDAELETLSTIGALLLVGGGYLKLVSDGVLLLREAI